MRIPDKIEEAMQVVSSYAGDCDDWMRIKKELLKSIPGPLRKVFSRRDDKTYERTMNDFERLVAARWKELTGVELKPPAPLAPRRGKGEGAG